MTAEEYKAEMKTALNNANRYREDADDYLSESKIDYDNKDYWLQQKKWAEQQADYWQNRYNDLKAQYDKLIANNGNDTQNGGDGTGNGSTQSGGGSTPSGGGGKSEITKHFFGAKDDTIYVWYSSSQSQEKINLYYNDVSHLCNITPVTVDVGYGNDYISNGIDSISISGNYGDDTINSSGSHVTISGGAGNDSISFVRSEVDNLIQYTAGDGFDTIENFNVNSTLSISGGTYSTQRSGANILVKVVNDTITLKNIYLTSDILNINGKVVELEHRNVSLTNGDDKVLITRDNVSVFGDAGNDYIYNGNMFGNEGGSLVSISGGVGNDTIENSGSFVTINGGAGKDFIDNYGDSVIISGDADNDEIHNGWIGNGDSVTIDGGDGNDYIWNDGGSNVSINSGAGDNTIDNEGENSTILAGDGNDYIWNDDDGSNASINAGAGNDSIENSGDDVTINAGAGDDSINNEYGKNVLFTYAAGDGNDTVYGFSANDTLQIGDGTGTYSTTKNGNDIVVTVGDGSILLQDAASLSVVNINGEEEVANPEWSINGARAIYGTLNETLIAVEGISDDAKASNFYISGKTITIGKAAVKTDGTAVKLLNQSDYTLKLGKGMTVPTDNAATLKNGGYTFGGRSAGYVLDTTNNTITYSAATTATLKLSGVKTLPTTPKNNVVTLELANFNNNLSVISNEDKYKFSIASGTYTGKIFTGSTDADTIANAGSRLIINAGEGNDSIKSSGTNSTINGGAGADTIAGSSGADTLLGNAGNDVIWGGKGNDSILGGTGNDSLSGYDGNDKISGDAGKDTILGGAGADTLYGGTDNDYLEGNAGNDSLSGAAGADTLWGGAGNDTLIGGAGNDIFIYKPNEGTDHITDYASGDILQILKADGSKGSYTKAAFASDKLTLTISGGGSVIFDNVSSGNKININGTTKTISGNTLK